MTGTSATCYPLVIAAMLLAPGFVAGAPPAHHGPATLLWIGLVLVVVASVAVAWFVRLRQHAGDVRHQPLPRLPLACPQCGRRFVAGTTFCAADACRLVTAAEGASVQAAAALRSGKCPRCRRAYDPGLRFCAIDAEELVPLPAWQSTHASPSAQLAHADSEEVTGTGATPVRVYLHGDGKICPLCASKYDLEAVYCGRDGAELMTVN